MAPICAIANLNKIRKGNERAKRKVKDCFFLLLSPLIAAGIWASFYVKYNIFLIPELFIKGTLPWTEDRYLNKIRLGGEAYSKKLQKEMGIYFDFEINEYD